MAETETLWGRDGTTFTEGLIDCFPGVLEYWVHRASLRASSSAELILPASITIPLLIEFLEHAILKSSHGESRNSLFTSEASVLPF